MAFAGLSLGFLPLSQRKSSSPACKTPQGTEKGHGDKTLARLSDGGPAADFYVLALDTLYKFS